MSLEIQTPRMAPPVPNRHPARTNTSAIKKPKLDPITGIPVELIHIWEHAVTLYQGFDWQASAENFLFLSRAIDRKLEGSLCLLNAAIIWARLGEFSLAAEVLNDVEPEGEVMSLTMFIIGHVEFELGNFDKAQECFQIALSNLNGPSQRYDHLGLDFVLRASHIQQDLRIFTSRKSLYGHFGTVGALPADGVFVCPTKELKCQPAPPSPTRTRGSTDSGYAPTLTDYSTPNSAAASPIDGYFDTDGSVWWQASGSEPELPVRVRQDSIAEGIEGIEQGLQDLQLRHPSKQTMASALSLDVAFKERYRREEHEVANKRSGSNLVRKMNPRQGPRDAFQRPAKKANPLGLQPRDARVAENTTADLAHVIRHLPSQAQKEPRPADGSSTSTRELAKFLRSREGLHKRTASKASTSDDSVYSIDHPLGSPKSVEDKEPQRLAQPPTPSPVQAYRNSSIAAVVMTEGLPYEQTEATDEPCPSNMSRWSVSTMGSVSSAAKTALPSMPSLPKRSISVKKPALPPPPPATPKTTTTTMTTTKPKAATAQPSVTSQTSTPNIPYSEYFPRFIAKRMSKW